MNLITVRQARKRMAKAFEDDPFFRQGYVDNVACVIMDSIPGYKRDKAKRDEIAGRIIRRIFE